ncbi:hypothetical protein [Microbacterium paulum]
MGRSSAGRGSQKSAAQIAREKAVARDEEETLAALQASLAALPKARRRELDAEAARRDRFVADRLGAKSLADYLAGPKVDVDALLAAERAFDKIEAATPTNRRERREFKRYMQRMTSTAKPAAARATSPSPAMEAPTAADHTPETPTPRRRLRAGHGGYLII